MSSGRPLILRNRDFGLLWTSQVFSQAGTKMYHIALLWWILEQAKQSEGVTAGFFMVLAALPAVVLVKFIGRVLDKTPSKVVLVSADLLASLVVLCVGMAMANELLVLWMVFLSGALVSTAEAFINPTLNKAVAELVEPEDVETAVSFETATQSVANFGGAVLGAILIDFIGIAGVIFFNACTYLISAGCNVFVRYKYAAEPSAEEATSDVSGWAILAGQPLIKRILITFGLMNFFASPIFLLLPLYVKNSLNQGATTLAQLEAGLWVGIILGAFASKHITIRNTLFVGFVTMSIFGLALALPGLVLHRWFYFVCLIVAGAMLGINNVKFIAYFQEEIASSIKGRFFSLMQALLGFSFPFAYFLFGVILDFTDAPKVCLLQGTGIIAIAVYLAHMSRKKEQFTYSQRLAKNM